MPFKTSERHVKNPDMGIHLLACMCVRRPATCDLVFGAMEVMDTDSLLLTCLIVRMSFKAYNRQTPNKSRTTSTIHITSDSLNP